MNNVFKALSDPTRRQILQMLVSGDLNAGEIADRFNVSKATVSHHLEILKNAGLVTAERKGQFIIYSANTTVIQELMAWFAEYFSQSHKKKRKVKKMEKIKKNPRVDWISIATIILSLVITAIVYSAVPHKIPGHWNIQGQIDRWADKSELFYMPVGFAVIYLLFLSLPLLDRKGGLKQRPEAYQKIIRSVMMLLFAVNAFRIVEVLGFHLPVDRMIVVMIGVFFAIMGNHLPQLKPNAFAGIRTPWTLKDDDNWRKTHRIGGFATIITGVLITTGGFLFKGAAVFISFFILMMLWAIGVIVYSYLISRKKRSEIH